MAAVAPNTMARMQQLNIQSPLSRTDSRGTGRSWPSATKEKEWQRAYSAGDIVSMQRTPKRRPFDQPHPTRDHSGVIPSMMIETSSLRMMEDEPSFGCESPASRSIRERAVDFWKVGDSMRITNHIEPTKNRPISLFGEVFQGFYNHDWKNVEHVQKARNRIPAYRTDLGTSTGVPYPQGRSQEEIGRNRNFPRSHGSPKLPGGLIRVGAQCMVP
mmetsp:Transcript_21539/g.33524  ORF Transcript_21539/g.33524 Transcript_21539/m.33524 type:complete len:215 (-) Transcript_21539:61-705(-)